MRTKLISIAGLGITALILGVASWKNIQAAHGVSATTSAMRAKLIALESAARRQDENLSAAEKTRLALQRELSSSAQPTPEAAPEPVVTELSIEAQLSRRQQERMRDPKVQLANLALERSRLATRYDPLYRSLGLSPEQRAKFEETMAKHNEGARDLMAAIEAQGFTSQQPGFGKLYSPLREKLDEVRDAAQRTVLGEDGFKRWQDYERSEGVRGVVADMTGAASALGVSLTGQQAEKLVGAMAQASKSYQEGHGASTLNVDWTLFDQKAREVLSAAQFAAFRDVEPQGGSGGRYWATVCAVLNESLRIDAEEAEAKAAAGRPGG